jgi:hypothetical protein
MGVVSAPFANEGMLALGSHAPRNRFMSQLYKNENLQANKYAAEYCAMQAEEVAWGCHEACEVLSSFGS